VSALREEHILLMQEIPPNFTCHYLEIDIVKARMVIDTATNQQVFQLASE
jgi:hypothetical protein